jgi:hypothetical protein
MTPIGPRALESLAAANEDESKVLQPRIHPFQLSTRSNSTTSLWLPAEDVERLDFEDLAYSDVA